MKESIPFINTECAYSEGHVRGLFTPRFLHRQKGCLYYVEILSTYINKNNTLLVRREGEFYARRRGFIGCSYRF